MATCLLKMWRPPRKSWTLGILVLTGMVVGLVRTARVLNTLRKGTNGCELIHFGISIAVRAKCCSTFAYSRAVTSRYSIAFSSKCYSSRDCLQAFARRKSIAESTIQASTVKVEDLPKPEEVTLPLDYLTWLGRRRLVQTYRVFFTYEIVED